MEISWKNLGSPIKIYEDSDVNLGVSNEDIGVCNENLGVSNEDIGVSDEITSSHVSAERQLVNVCLKFSIFILKSVYIVDVD